jgi:inner membrane protein
MGFFSAMFPDADALLDPFSPDFYITQHRGLSHSFLLLPVWAVALAALAMIGNRVPRTARALAFRRLVAICGVGVASHILLDWITAWGTMFLSPLSWTRYALDWVFIIDFALSGILLVGLAGTLLVFRRSDSRGRWAARASLVAAVLYIGLCAQKHREALRVCAKLASDASDAESLKAAIPQPLSPDRWLLLADDGTVIRATFVDLGKRGHQTGYSSVTETMERATPSAHGIGRLVRDIGGVYLSLEDARPRLIPKSDGPLAKRTLAEGVAGIFGRFARFPAARESRESDGRTTVTLRDVRFGYLSNALDPFTYLVKYDSRNRLLYAGFPSKRWARNGVTQVHAAD